MAGFLNDRDLVINGGTGGEENKALYAFSFTVHVVKFLTEYFSFMGRSHVGMYDSSTILTETKKFSTKVNHGRSEPLTKYMEL